MFLYEPAPLGEGQHEMQEQRWLKHPRHHVAPVNPPVERVQLAGVMERIENE